ncbi:ABC transporter substrate-binding protein [Actinoalloteichus spitiensis]|uniref:ABC transporter substrate-binding protein n=1 Tax=Actinoalloteichus spitiensis TaxID=252394 RepID=UPI000379E042|nr:ABC transporter substrate-binding protein [Actinoalloteichus spitiensis]
MPDSPSTGSASTTSNIAIPRSTPTPRRRTLLTALATTTALTAAACSGDAGTGPTTNSLTIYDGATGQFSSNFNPFLETSNGAARGMIHETLLFFNRAAADDIRPMLAEDHSWSEDGTTVTFTLRDDVRWSDGEPFTSDDVVYTFEAMAEHPGLNRAALPIASATAHSETEVSITFDRPSYSDLWFIAGQTYIVPEHHWADIEDPVTHLNSDPVGTGAFALDSFSAQSIALAANTDYWDPEKPHLDTIRFVSHSGNQTALSALQAGQVDWSGIFIPDVENTFVNRAEGNVSLAVPQFITVLMPNLEEGPTRDRAVRRALYYGIEREQVNDLAFEGYHELPSPAQIILPRDEAWLAEEFRGEVAGHEPDRARRILEDAGYQEGTDGVFVSPDGERLSLDVKVVTGYTDQINAIQVMADQLAEVGIELRTQEVSRAAFVSDRDNGRFDLAIDSLYGGPDPFGLYDDFLNSAAAAPLGEPASKNYARFRDDDVDEALTRIAGTDDQDAHREAYATIQRRVAEELPYIPVLQTHGVAQFAGGRITGWPSEDDPYALPMPYSYPDIGVVAANLRPAG